MGSSPGFGSTSTHSNALFRLAFASAPPNGLTLRVNITRWLIMQKARSHSKHSLSCITRAPTACKHTVSGSISLAVQASFSPFPHGTCPLSVTREYLALGGGPPGFPQDFTEPAVLGNVIQGWIRISATGLSPSMEVFSNTFAYTNHITSATLPCRPKTPHNTVQPTLADFQLYGLGCSHFARRYSGNRNCFLFLRVLRCFSSPRWPPCPMDSDRVAKA
jgi:hypothetical protein